MSDRSGRHHESRAARLAGELRDRVVGRSEDERDAGWDPDEARLSAERDAGVPGQRDRGPDGAGHADPAQPPAGDLPPADPQFGSGDPRVAGRPEAAPPSVPPGGDPRGPASVGDGRGAATPDDGSSLIAPDRARGYQERWNVLKGEFVDEPRRAVHGANELVGEVLDELEDLFRRQRDTLEQQFSRQDASTEDLRQALGRYREFFDRLLSL